MIEEVPDAVEKGYQCSGGTMDVYRGAKLYNVGGIYLCEWCIVDVADELREGWEIVFGGKMKHTIDLNKSFAKIQEGMRELMGEDFVQFDQKFIDERRREYIEIAAEYWTGALPGTTEKDGMIHIEYGDTKDLIELIELFINSNVAMETSARHAIGSMDG